MAGVDLVIAGQGRDFRQRLQLDLHAAAGKVVRPQEPAKSVSPVKSASPQMSVTPPGVWPGVSMTRKVRLPTLTSSPSL